MSVNETHWTDYLKPEESAEADRLALAILKNKDELTELRRRERRLFEIGTSRRRRAMK